MKDLSVQSRFVELRGQGWSYDRIAKELGVTRQTLINWSKELKSEIANVRAIHHEGLLEALRVQKSERIRCLASQFEKIRLEMEARPLTEIPADKLLDYQLKVLNALKSETTEILELCRNKAPWDDVSVLGPSTEVEVWRG